MNAIGVGAILDILIRIVVLAPNLATSYKKIVDALHKTGEITTTEWETRKADYIATMGGDAWKTDTPTE